MRTRSSSKSPMKLPVSRRAVIQRINRVLAKDEQVLRATRGDRWRHDLGDFYIVDFNRNAIMQKAVDPEELARKLKVLADHEELRADG